MARVAKTVETTKFTPPGRKPRRLANVAAKSPIKSRGAATSFKRTGSNAEAVERRKPGRPAKVIEKKMPKATRSVTAARPPAAALPAPKVSKDALRAQVEKLESVIASLRAKSREANKAAKAATARISELEMQVAQLKKATAAPAFVQQPKPAKPARAKRQSREIDPGDAVPPGVAAQEPAPLDEEAEIALENLEEHLSHN